MSGGASIFTPEYARKERGENRELKAVSCCAGEDEGNTGPCVGAAAGANLVRLEIVDLKLVAFQPEMGAARSTR